MTFDGVFLFPIRDISQATVRLLTRDPETGPAHPDRYQTFGW